MRYVGNIEIHTGVVNRIRLPKGPVRVYIYWSIRLLDIIG